MKKYLICNDGCDDSTEFEIELTDEEVKTLVKVFNANNKKANYQCRPSIFIYDEYEVEEEGWYNRKHCLNKTHDELKGEDK